ncbi:MAG TPA: TadE family protein [Candidatus Nanopelagicaceae bacterium]
MTKTEGQSGSAAVEFVLLAVPLFLPIFFYITQFAEVSGKEMSARSLVREVVRAYVASENLEAAEQRANVVLQYGGQRLGFSQNELSSMALTFSCSSFDCLTPGERVRADIRLKLPISNREVHVSAQEYVSPWQ